MSIHRIDPESILRRRLEAMWLRLRAWPRCEKCGSILAVDRGKVFCRRCGK